MSWDEVAAVAKREMNAAIENARKEAEVVIEEAKKEAEEAAERAREMAENAQRAAEVARKVAEQAQRQTQNAFVSAGRETQRIVDSLSDVMLVTIEIFIGKNNINAAEVMYYLGDNVKTHAFNEAKKTLPQLQRKISQVEEDLSELEKEISDLRNEVEKAQSDLNDLVLTSSQKQAILHSLQNALENYEALLQTL